MSCARLTPPRSTPGPGPRPATSTTPMIQDKLAVRLSAFDQKDQGFVDNVRLGLADDNDVHQYGGRAAVTFKPIDNLKINLHALWYRLTSDDNNAVRLTNDITSEKDAHG